MPEPVSTTLGICWLGYAALNAYAQGGTAVSAEAQTVREVASSVVELADRSQALFGEKAFSISRLIALAQQCGQPGWDGTDAEPVSTLAVMTAEAFLRALPDDCPMPELAADPDGALSLDWIGSKSRIFSLSIGPTNRLAYAWVDGADRGHAVARFDGQQIPPRVLDGVQSIIPYADSSFRAA